MENLFSYLNNTQTSTISWNNFSKKLQEEKIPPQKISNIVEFLKKGYLDNYQKDYDR